MYHGCRLSLKSKLIFWVTFDVILETMEATVNISVHFVINKLSRLSSTNKERMEIGSGTLEMTLDAQLEERVDFWSKIW